MDNKSRTRQFLQMLAVFVYASLTIGTVATALNSKPGAFLTVVSLLTLVCNGVICYLAGKKIANEE